MQTITNIATHTSPSNGQMLGYTFTINDDDAIRLKISGEQNCCEQFGVYVANTCLESFIGAEYQGIHIGPVEPIYGEEQNSQQIIIQIYTSIGTICIRFYNIHNGYYKHDVSISYFGTSYYVAL